MSPKNRSLPGPQGPPWYARELWSTVSGLGTVLAAGAAVVKAWTTQELLLKLTIAAAVLAAVQFAFKSAQAHYKDSERTKAKSPADLSACLHVLHSIITRKVPGQTGSTNILRMTIHRAIERERLEQCVGYVGGKGGDPGRRFSDKSGISGRAFRLGAVVTARRRNTDHDQFLHEMVEDWGFSAEEAKALSGDRMAWMAVPIKDEANDAVIGVVFFDSSNPDYFSQPVQELAIAGCVGLSKYISQHYT